MPKGYWIAHVDVHDPESYKAYIAALPAVWEKWGARYLIRAGQSTPAEGETAGARHVVIEFPSYAAALDCYNSPEYQAARAHRVSASTGSITVVEGYE